MMSDMFGKVAPACTRQIADGGQYLYQLWMTIEDERRVIFAHCYIRRTLLLQYNDGLFDMELWHVELLHVERIKTNIYIQYLHPNTYIQ